jgi:cysteine-rich repeat protein
MRRPTRLLVVLALLGCVGRPLGGQDSRADTSGSDADTSTTTGVSETDGEGSHDTESPSETTETETSATETSETETSETETGGPVCGDGIVDLGELCDDGNLPDGDLCPSDCQIPISPCGNAIYACGDVLDNDRDGRIDLYDPDCTSPCDDDEGSFSTSLPGQNSDCKPDCNWDTNTGAGDDTCETQTQCDPQNPGELAGCEYDPLFQNCPSPSETCVATCLPISPNACDCFGCCEFDGVFRSINGEFAQCGSDDTGACTTCTPQLSCLNVCDPQACELCMLQEPSELPDNCAEPACPVGVEPCVEPYACGAGQMCRTGCCVPLEI